MRRRQVMSGAALACLGLAAGWSAGAEPQPVKLGEPMPFDADTMRRKARDLAGRPYAPPSGVPQAWQNLTYDQYRSIWFAEKHALWRGTGRPAQVDFFPAGNIFNRTVTIGVVRDGQALPVAFDLSYFDKTDKFPDLSPDGMGFSGFRLRGEVEKPGIFQEYAVFQGASYFRAIGRGQVYGLSARGLALGTGSPEGEEFPAFREFWIEEPPPGATEIIIHALLDSPSVAGAYRFTISKGSETVIGVSCSLFPRVDLAAAGIAPGTSMFLFDQTNRVRFDDFRDAVHDSEGLLMLNGTGEQIWRPLANPKRLGNSYFADSGTRGFGLMQRSRKAEDFGDLEAEYHRRPSLWVEPLGAWGPGFVVLVEIPADKEIYDNIVAFWRPAEPLRAGQEHRFAYRLYWTERAPVEGAVAPVINTRSGRRVFEPGRIFTVDFAPHSALGDDPAVIDAMVRTQTGRITSKVVQRNPATGGMRLDFTLVAPDGESAEMRAELYRDGKRVSEIWLYRWGG